jgi:hypothetical protein
MITIEFRDLSMPDAEEVIVALWNCFEEYEVPSPAMTFGFRRGARATVQVHIEDAALADIVTEFLSNWNVVRRRGRSIPIASGRFRPASATGAGHLWPTRS